MINLGINAKSYTVKEAIMQGEKSVLLPCGTCLWLEQREAHEKAQFKRYKHMYDLPEAALKRDDIIVDEDHGFHVVSNDRSVLFYSGGMLHLFYFLTNPMPVQSPRTSSLITLS